MELNYLKEFVVLSQIGNYLAAADELFISQSSLSRHIKSLEEEIGFPLFERTTRKISLSKFGEVFLPYAKEITQIQTNYQSAIADFKKSMHETLHIGSIPSIAQYKIIDLLLRFQQENAEFTLDLIENDSIILIHMLESQELELAFVRSKEDLDDKYQRILFAEDTLAAIMPSTHPLAKRDQVALSDLSKETLLLLSTDTYMYQFCVNECRKAGFEPNVGYTGRRSENIIAMVKKGAGIALLTRNPIMPLVNPQISIVKIIPLISSHISLIYNKNRPLSKPARQFIDLL